MHQFKKHVLPNGLRILFVPQPQGMTATVLVLVEAGSEYETKKINGVSHFLEHMCFKGTKKRPNALTISSEIESLGAANNAFTSHQMTGYYAKVQPAKFFEALDIIADIYVNPVFDEKEIEKEKGVIVEELNMYEDNPMRKVADLFSDLLYGDQPAGWDIGGTKETVRAMTKKDIVSYRKDHYVAKATAVVVAGPMNEQEVLSSIKKLFKDIPVSKKFAKNPVKENQTKPAVLAHYKKSDQTHIILGFRSFSLFDKRRYALDVLEDVLGGGMSSRLFQRVREKLGAAYYVRAGSDLFTDHGFSAISAGLDNTRTIEVIGAILDELRKICDKPVTEKELQKSKNHIIGNFLMGLESSDDLANFYGSQEIARQKIAMPKEMVKKIESVTAGEVQKVARDIMKNQGLNLALIGPFEDKKPFEKILKL
ncbi:MAG: pitrilysin family protein [bacterium]|nr:pitrilysin family protein [bacterium]